MTRSLDALHLATALEIGPQLSGVLTYDTRMAEAAEVPGPETPDPALVAGLAAISATCLRVGGQLSD